MKHATIGAHKHTIAALLMALLGTYACKGASLEVGRPDASMDADAPADVASDVGGGDTPKDTLEPEQDEAPDDEGPMQDPLTVRVSVDALRSVRDRDLLPRDPQTDIAKARLQGSLEGLEHPTRINAYVRPDQAPPEGLCQGQPAASVRVAPANAGSAAFTMEVPVELALPSAPRDIVLCVAGDPTARHRVRDVIVGDIVLIAGQSNASARLDARGQFPTDAFKADLSQRDPRIRTLMRDGRWYEATGDVMNNRCVSVDTSMCQANTEPVDVHGQPQAEFETRAHVGQWGLRMAKVVLEQSGVPLGVINGAFPGTLIFMNLPDPSDHANPDTTYGALFERLELRGLREHVRAIFWYQGESDASAIRVRMYQDSFDTLYAAWKADYPNLEQTYVFQVRQGCFGLPFNPDMLNLQELLRSMTSAAADISLISTTGISAHDGCHYPFPGGYKVIGEHAAALLMLDLYGVRPADPAQTPGTPDFLGATVNGAVVSLSMRPPHPSQGYAVDPGNEPFFRVMQGGTQIGVSGVRVSPTDKHVLELQLSAPVSPGPLYVAYVGHSRSGPWVTVDGTGVGIPNFEVTVQAP